MSKKKKSPRDNLTDEQKDVYDRGLAAYMSSGNKPNVSQHQWAMARVKSDFGKKEAAKIRREKGKKDDDTLKKNMRTKKMKK